MAKKTILVVDDEEDILELVRFHLAREGYTVLSAETGEQAWRMVREQPVDLALVDLMLPGIDGLELTRRFKNDAKTSNIPVVMLTAKGEEVDIVTGLELGADDYVTKPFSPQELVSRVRAVLRRARALPVSSEERPLSFEHLSINPQTRLVRVGEKEIGLTAKEFDMLYYLARHPRRVFTRDELLEKVWGHSEYIDPGTVTVHIRRLREKIEVNPSHPVRLVTVWGVGYKFDP